MAKAPALFFHTHLISDSTGETLLTLARAVFAQRANVHPIEHLYPAVRTQKQLDRILKEISGEPGMILMTLIDKDLSSQIRTFAEENNLPCLGVLDPVMELTREAIDETALEQLLAETPNARGILKPAIKQKTGMRFALSKTKVTIDAEKYDDDDDLLAINKYRDLLNSHTQPLLRTAHALSNRFPFLIESVKYYQETLNREPIDPHEQFISWIRLDQALESVRLVLNENEIDQKVLFTEKQRVVLCFNRLLTMSFVEGRKFLDEIDKTDRQSTSMISQQNSLSNLVESLNRRNDLFDMRTIEVFEQLKKIDQAEIKKSDVNIVIQKTGKNLLLVLGLGAITFLTKNAISGPVGNASYDLLKQLYNFAVEEKIADRVTFGAKGFMTWFRKVLGMTE